MELSESRDLRGGNPCWVPNASHAFASDTLPASQIDVLIIGAGIMGAMLADRLSAQGLQLLLLDRRPPAQGATAASTALVMWGADTPLSLLSEKIGEKEAVRRWKRVHAAAGNLARYIDSEGIDCARIDRPELYLAGTLLDEKALRAEGDMRRTNGLPSEFIAADAVAERFDIHARPALLSAGSYEVDPVKLTLALLARARDRGAKACFPIDAVALSEVTDGVIVTLNDGRTVKAKRIILATGYERSPWFLPPAFRLSSSFAIATRPGTAPMWRENAMIWEASSPYLYTRATADGRVIAGGEDEDFSDASKRDALISAKSGTIAAKLAAMIAVEDIAVDCAWAAAFGGSPDGLPAIGQAANHDRVWLAYGFGGNGVTFAALGAELLTAEFAGDRDGDADCFSPYRFG